MEDHQIVALYWAREEQAITESAAKYGGYCLEIALRILAAREDAEECVNDTWLRAWDAMPPHRPERLDTFLGKIARNLSLDRWKRSNAQKRVLFVQRYWYLCSVKDIAARHGMGESAVTAVLFRLRRQLRDRLEKEGFAI